MAFVGTILQEVVKFKKNRIEKKVVYDERLQVETLIKLLKKARRTAFGKHYGFESILKGSNKIEDFQKKIPVFDYNKMHDEWWYRTLQDEEDIAWPGKIKFFALTSGTSGSPSKRIPVSMEMLQAMRKTSINQMLTLYDLGMPKEFYQKPLCMVGGSAKLKKVGSHLEGDLSGILATQVPRWFYRFRKPAKKIASIQDWETKLQTITENAHKWDIGIICGVPAWVQILFERIVEHYQVDSVHDIWPNLSIYVHGGVAFGPYKETIKKNLGKELVYLDTYLASEGFMAFEHALSKPNMQLALDKGIFFEFIPFNENNFDAEGKLRAGAKILSLYEVEEDVNYAVLISTCAGVWRYLIGDTLKFTSLKNFEILLTGRTKHFLSLCGEHLSVENMTKAIELSGKELNVNINEFTVSGRPHKEGLFQHNWFIGTNDSISETKFKSVLDQHLKILNDDYATERGHALKDITLTSVPLNKFHGWMEKNGKVGGQSKFPRVLNQGQFNDWSNFIKN